MPLDLYYIPGSAPCRSVMLVAKAVDVDLNLILMNRADGDFAKPEFTKLNPQRTIPTLNDNGFVLLESRAILVYLVQQYGKDDSLYPKDAKSRAMVDQRLYFDIGTLYHRFSDYYYPVMFAGAPYDPAKLAKLEEAYLFLNKLLEGQTWVAGGENCTIADISIAVSVSTAEIIGFDIGKYSNVVRWLANAITVIPGYEEINRAGALQFKKLFDQCTAKE